MDWKLFKKINQGVAWLSFLLATITYLLTISHSANLWDTAEFVVCIHKLEVGHPPGSPFFMLVYNLVTQFTSDPSRVAMLCNVTSAVLSGFTILFLYLTITHLARRLVAPGIRNGQLADGTPMEKPSMAKGLGIIFAGFGGAMLYAFSDTFWYSAVEAEVYAFSSFFTALVVWLMLEWEERSEDPSSDRWLILIAYCFGLSIGVHLLNLLCLPAMALIFYFRKAKKPTIKRSIGVLLGSFILIAVLMFGVIQGSMKVASIFDLFAVNTLGLSFNSGLVIYCLILLLLIVVSLVGMHKKGLIPLTRVAVLLTLILVGIPFISDSAFLWVVLIGVLVYLLFAYKKLTLRLLYTVQLSLALLTLGFASYGVIVIRSAALPPMNENNPSTPYALKKYLNREQYGSIPLFKGPSFTSRVIDYKEKNGEWIPSPKNTNSEPDRYIRGQKVRHYTYDHEMLFPRVYSTLPEHIRGYNLWMNRSAEDMSTPSFAESLKFFFSYQVNYMYWRYFAWNFIGRQNDIQGNGGMLSGGVSTGIDFIDRLSYGKAEYYPDEIAQNKGHNVYFLLPLLLGILGIVFQLAKGARGVQSFWIVFFFFFMTGLAIIIYINQPPYQPRERDYAYAGSFYAFAIWIGLGIIGIWNWIAQKKKNGERIATIATALVAVAVPLQMLSQNYDDHDRSKRTAAADMGHNFLESCGDNAIVFCFGDNDTFPLWYAQEIEGVKRDARATNLSYLAAEWYIDQMRSEAYHSAPLPFKLMTPSFYYPTLFVNVVDGPSLELGEALDRIPSSSYEGQYFIPSKSLYLPLDSSTMAHKFPGVEITKPSMEISLQDKHFLSRDNLAVLDILRTNNWERPIYWLKTTPANAFSNLGEYFVSSGAAWQVYPTPMQGRSDNNLTDHEYDLVMNKFRWFGASRSNNYFDANIRNSIITLYRAQLIPSLVQKLLERGDGGKAKEVLAKCFKELPSDNLPYTYSDLNLALACYQAKSFKEGDLIIKDLLSKNKKGIKWFDHLSNRLKQRAILEGEVERFLSESIDALQVATDAGRIESFKEEAKYFSEVLSRFYGKKN